MKRNDSQLSQNLPTLLLGVVCLLSLACLLGGVTTLPAVSLMLLSIVGAAGWAYTTARYAKLKLAVTVLLSRKNP